MHFVSVFIGCNCVLFLVKLRWPKKKDVYDIRLVGFEMFNLQHLDITAFNIVTFAFYCFYHWREV